MENIKLFKLEFLVVEILTNDSPAVKEMIINDKDDSTIKRSILSQIERNDDVKKFKLPLNEFSTVC